jgi:4-amino-4-deoxy-L-arabinose transferase-like glycosyltransferase
MALVILVFYFILFGYQVSYQKLTGREGAIRAYLITFGITAIITELLSIFDLVTIRVVFVTWCFITAVLVIIFLWKLKSDNWKFPKNEKFFKSPRFKDYSTLERIILLTLLCILLFTFIIAFFSPPNNFDSMTYHMARVVHWIQQKSIKFYPTSIPRQNHSMPLAEYQILHLQLLSQSDKYANLVQWIGFVVLVVLVSEFTKLLGVSRKGQLLAGLFAATTPMAILQSSSTQNDILVAVFCLTFAYYLLKTIKSPSLFDAILGGVAFGLALLTKGTAYIFCAAIGLVYGFVGLIYHPRKARIRFIQNLSIMIFCALILNVGFYQRNLNLYGNPLSSETGRLTVDDLSFSGLYSNLVRNGSAHLAVPIPILNVILSDKVINHLGDLVDDQDITFPGTTFQIRFLINDDESVNPIHLVLISIIILLFVVKREKRDLNLYTHIITVILSIILFSWLLKWQPWGSRLQLPIFVLGAPLVGYYFDKVNQSRVINFVITVSLLNTNRQVLYFSSSIGLYEDYQTVTAVVADLNEEYIGLDLGGNDWEYPIWVFAKSSDSEGYLNFIHVGVEDISQRLNEKPDLYPDYVISTRVPPGGWLMDNNYEIIVDTPSIDLYQRR